MALDLATAGGWLFSVVTAFIAYKAVTVRSIAVCVLMTHTIANAADWNTAYDQLAQASMATQPTQLELEYWRSAERIGSPEAYRAYLDAFPGGFFARLAAAAIVRLPHSSTEPTPQPVGPIPLSRDAQLTPSQVARIAGEPETGAVGFRVGDSFFGPGPLTVGWFGAKNQVVVPNGRWTVLAATDGYSTHSPRIQMTSVALGSFERNRLRSLLVAVFNSRPGPAWATWTDAQKCEAADTAQGLLWKSPAPALRQCITLKSIATFNKPDSWKGQFWESIYRFVYHPFGGPGASPSAPLHRER